MLPMIDRRTFLRGVAAVVPAAAAARVSTQGAAAQAAIGPLDTAVLPRGIRSRIVNGVNGIRMHVLEAGYEDTAAGGARKPAVLLVHGFPELAYSWRKVMPSIAAAGYHVIAPDLRGYGRSGGTGVAFDDDLSPWRTINEVTDMVSLVSAIGYRTVAAVVGHDFGSPVAAWCAVIRPDVFRSVALMSAPFGGTATLPFATADRAAAPQPPQGDTINDDLARLTPPRKYYQRYYSTREADANMHHATQGLQAFLRGYYHMKSADWKANQPHPLAARTAAEWAKMPRYYVMDLNKGMAETVAAEMPSAAQIAACTWLPDSELRVYADEYGRTGFQGGLQSYRVGSTPRLNADLQVFGGRTIDQPSMFIAGASDWGAYQNPGALERMQKVACTKMTGVHFVDGAGHWVQQEQAEKVSGLLIAFLKQNPS
jgi:pimeloyl-ACP methyl ester carboxylesterase